MKSKRIWAMMGVVYMVIFVLLMVYWMATMQLIRGITGIMVFPACGALSAQYANRRWIIRHGRQGHVEDPDFVEPDCPQAGGTIELLLAIFFAGLAAVSLGFGVMQLLAYFAIH